jgi:hypothetical protein
MGAARNLGDRQCYLGFQAKVAAVQAAMSHRIASENLPVRLIPSASCGICLSWKHLSWKQRMGRTDEW